MSVSSVIAVRLNYAYGKFRLKKVSPESKLDSKSGRIRIERKNLIMNFKKANKDKQQEIKVAVETKVKTAKETLGKLVLSISIALLIFTLVNISSENEKTTLTEMVTVTTSEEYEETGTATSTNITTTKVTTTTAKAVTTTPVTTAVTVATTEVETEAVDVPATERSVVIEVENKNYMEPVHEEPQVVEIVETEPGPPAPEVNNELAPEPTVQEQSYYSDDGDYGWSHVAVRYSTPSLDADKERYHAANEYVTEEERILLVNIVASEYGSDWVSVSEKAKIVAVVMNRVNDNYNGKTTIYDVLTDYGQFQGYSPQSWFYRSTTPTCIDAVDYYFLHKDEWQYQGIKYISGHGSYNSFS